MKRLLAGVLAVCLLALTGLESFHAHAKAHEKSCAACSLEMQAAGVVLHSPKAPAFVRSCSKVVLTVQIAASAPFVALSHARSPPATA